MSDTPSALSPSQTPVGVDPARPSIARIYDGFLGGNNFYEVDRVVMEKIRAAVPEAVDIARGNRGFHNRALRMLAGQTKISQFVDCGSGLPTAENTHQIVQRIDKDNTVVYVDNDPVVLAHGRALLVENDFTHMVEADIFQPQEVLGHKEVLAHVDFSEPVACCRWARCTTTRATASSTSCASTSTRWHPARTWCCRTSSTPKCRS